jgi:hypothetical protein
MDDEQQPVDSLDALVMRQGGYSTRLSWMDRQKLRSIVKRVHMSYYPQEMITDYEADKMIDAIAPATAEYLIRKHLGGE